jgi:parvulin-like peptidyl-prolyl isomerase
MRWQRLLRSAAALIGAVVGWNPAPLTAQPLPPLGVRQQKTDAKPIVAAKSEIPATPPRDTQVVIAVVALVNNEPILNTDLNTIILPQLATLRMPPTDEGYKAKVKEIKSAALELLIERHLLVKDAETKLKLSKKESLLAELKQEAADQVTQRLKKLRDQYPSEEAMNEFLRRSGTSLAELKTNQYHLLLAQEYLRSNVMHDIDLGYREIYEYYQGHPEEFRRTDSVQWQDIFIDAAKYPNREAAYREADDLVTQARANGGDDFVKLCEKYDNGLAKTRKGAGLGTRREDISPPEAAAVLFQMRDGDIGPIVTVRDGFHVIRLVKRTLPGLAPFDEEVQKAVKEKLKSEIFSRRSKWFIEELKRNAQIERFPF